MKKEANYSDSGRLLLQKLVVTPLIVGSVGVLGLIWWYAVIPAFLLNGWYWYRYNQRHRVTTDWLRQVFAQVITLAYYLGIYIVVILINQYNYLGIPAAYPFSIFTYNLTTLFAGSLAVYDPLPWFFIGSFWSGVLGLWAYRLRSGQTNKPNGRQWCSLIILILVSLVPVWLHFQRNERYLGLNDRFVTNTSELNLKQYQPFTQRSRAAKLNRPATLRIHNNYPKINGATAAYPVEAAIAQNVYAGVTAKQANQLVRSDSTPKAFNSLLKNQADVIFMAHPSKDQYRTAKRANVKLQTQHVADEAFVFFVNKHNPVNNLTTKQIQSIYQRKMLSWSQVGGQLALIQAFQRPAGSGSQTIMESLVMKDKTMAAPLRYQEVSTMGEIIDDVAGYNNSHNAIGYSFRFYTTQMKLNKNVKVLKVNGVAPTAQNIRNGRYPYITPVYAIYRSDASKHTHELVNWVGGQQGQALINQTGYVGRKR
ncbi:phosphate ABC transporter substrate-binding protein [Lactiplantibacillus garii]|uniref:Phosphate ABC transporter substrate-binding protein n=1 Tax=Lactiplantibacillus garii TaxID=2306423 RepID=A0A426D3H7_9LACO|nr:substrate-binding domain-containing protein [Lactiplantibacillus garii]RRK09235.1 phosphate ABC transporter substrate-binding protein [Lactiplantibacillus garii]